MNWTKNKSSLACTKVAFGSRWNDILRLRFSLFFFFFSRDWWLFCMNNAPVHCSWDPQTSLFNNFLIKNGSHGTIHTFKNYFATIFSVFNFQLLVFNCIQTDLKLTKLLRKNDYQQLSYHILFIVSYTYIIIINIIYQ